MKFALLAVKLMNTQSPLAMAEWIEIYRFPDSLLDLPSPLAMAEWIEIYQHPVPPVTAAVSASDGGVD